MKCDCFANEYTFGAKTLRLALGLLFVMVAIKKFRMGYFGFAESLVSGEGHLASEVPHFLLYAYGAILPLAELVVGVLLLVGKYTRYAYVAIALIYFSFIFGQMYDGNTSKVGTEYFPSLLLLAFASFFEEKAHKAS